MSFGGVSQPGAHEAPGCWICSDAWRRNRCGGLEHVLGLPDSTTDLSINVSGFVVVEGPLKQSRAELVAFVGGQILPHEADVRAWLRRTGSAPADIDDVVQETYCRLAALDSVAHIASGRAYFFRTARNISIEKIRRARIVRIDCVTEIDALNVVDDEPSPERVVAGRRELGRVQQLIEGLPERCRQIFTLRRIHGLSQREIAARLGVTENVVETQSARGLRLILRALSEATAQDQKAVEKTHELQPVRKRD
jgi:RNA polymerase sigma factor (sigma-70 family)